MRLGTARALAIQHFRSDTGAAENIDEIDLTQSERLQRRVQGTEQQPTICNY